MIISERLPLTSRVRSLFRSRLTYCYVIMTASVSRRCLLTSGIVDLLFHAKSTIAASLDDEKLLQSPRMRWDILGWWRDCLCMSYWRQLIGVEQSKGNNVLGTYNRNTVAGDANEDCVEKCVLERPCTKNQQSSIRTQSSLKVVVAIKGVRPAKRACPAVV